MTRRVAVVGGGISGLTAAFRLMQQGQRGEPLEVMLFEASDRLGGVIQTDMSQGVVLEGGPDSFLRRKPQAIHLAEELGLGDQLMSTNPQVRGSYIFHSGHFADIPLGVQAGIPTRLDTMWGTELLTMGEKIRMLGDLSLPRKPVGDDVALGTLLRYRLGDGYVDRIAAPMLSGIYAGDIDQLSTAVTVPQLLAYQRRGRSLIQEAQKQAAQAPPPAAGTPPSMFASLVRGVGSLVDALERAIAGYVDVQRESPVLEIQRGSDSFMVKTLGQAEPMEFSDVIVAVPAHQAARMLTFWSDETRSALANIPYADLAVVGAVYDPDAFQRALDKTGFLVPKGEGVEMTAGTWVRSKWHYPDQTPLVPIRAFYGRAGDKTLLTQSDEDMLSRFRQEMGYIMGVTDAPRFARVFRIPQGMPQYLVGHHRRAELIRAEAERFGIPVIGSYFDGVGVPDCIRHATEAVSALASRWGTAGVRA